MAKLPDCHITKRLFVGEGLAACLGVSAAEIRGSAYIEGPAVVGVPLKFLPYEAGVMISNVQNTDMLAVPAPSIVKIRSTSVPTPIDVVIGDIAGPVGVNIFCGPMPFVVSSTSISLNTLLRFDVSNFDSKVASLKSDIGAKFFAGTKLETGFDSNLGLAFNAAPLFGEAPAAYPDFASDATTLNTTYGIALSKKPFDILHPTKDGHRLRYVSLEGPAAEVYCRGKSTSDVIDLPDYWLGLVEEDSITVNLTSVGSEQNLYVKEIVDNKIYVGGGVLMNGERLFKYHYTVFAERKDTEKNIPEYKGLTPDDYPGDNSEYRLS
jgi:hypothetical protein